MKTNNTQHIEKWRKAHHLALESLRADTCELSGIQIWRKLVRLEHVASQITTAACNGETVRINGWPVSGKLGWNHEIAEIDFCRNENAHDFAVLRLTDCVRAIFGHVPKGFFVNFDARGNALKIEPEHTPAGMHQDWGRNGILAAEIN